MNIVKLAFALAFLIVLPINNWAADGDQFTHIFQFQLNETKLSDIQKSLGYVERIETGDAAEYNASLCYFLAKQNITIEFWSSEPGDSSIVDGLMAREDRTPAKSCRILHDKRIQTSDLGSLRLGMTLHEFEKLMINSEKQTGLPKVEYHFTYKKPKPELELAEERKYSFDPPITWDILIQVIGYFKNNRLVEIRIFKSVTD